MLNTSLNVIKLLNNFIPDIVTFAFFFDCFKKIVQH